MTENDCWYVDGNKVQVYPMADYMGEGMLNYSCPINGGVLYGLLRRNDWNVYVSYTNPICIMISTHGYVDIYSITRREFDKFLHYYCGNGFLHYCSVADDSCRHKQELDWRKCGF